MSEEKEGLKWYRVYGSVSATKELGFVQAKNKEEAISLAGDLGDTDINICHQCAEEVDGAEICEIQAEEVEPENVEEDRILGDGDVDDE